jgi:hypothetical protein
MGRTLRELEAVFLKMIDDCHWQEVDEIAGSDGIRFLCPVCFEGPPPGPIGCHIIVCWQPHVSQDHIPKPGRWNLVGSNIDDLSLVAGSSSIQIIGGCNAHFHVIAGRIVP